MMRSLTAALGLLLAAMLGAGPAPAFAEPTLSDAQIAALKKKHRTEKAPEIALLSAFVDGWLVALIPSARTDMIHLDFISTRSNRVLSLFPVQRKKDGITLQAYNKVRLKQQVNGVTTNQSPLASIVLGHVPFPEFTEIEIQWNCEISDVRPINPAGYFLLWRAGENTKSCDTKYVFNEAGERFLISKDPDTGSLRPVKAD